MKVIGAGFPKTGTKSLWRALEILGYNHMDMPTWVDHLLDDWVDLMKGDINFDQLCEKLETFGAESCTDLPYNLYWEEFFKKYPDSKVVLTVRDDDQVFYKSWRRYIDVVSQTSFVAGPDAKYYEQDAQYAKWIWVVRDHWRSFFGTAANPFVTQTLSGLTKKELDSYVNEERIKQRYRMHNCYVMSTVPKERLLVYNLKEGWEPLCKFLNKPVPDQPMPQLNVWNNLSSNDWAVGQWLQTKLIKNRDATVERLKKEELTENTEVQ